MPKYVITITETLKRRVAVDADDKNEAMAKVKQLYDNNDIVLDTDDFIDVNFNVES